MGARLQRKDEEGQALIEFILFLPFLIALLSLLVTISSSINGAINQQKAARSYFYLLIRNNSTMPLPQFVYALKNQGMTNIGMFSIGWMDEQAEGGDPVASCYQINSMLAGGNSDECKDHYDHQSRTSRQIKVFTAYGACGNLYSVGERGNIFHNTVQGGSMSACAIGGDAGSLSE